jgi:murein DD-endopeptidase MepM/ murein hydrolase activator NlpD
MRIHAHTAALLVLLLASSPPTAPPTQPATQPAAQIADPTGTGSWPLFPEPEVVAGFAPPSERWQSGHRGVDLLGRVGQSVLSARAGVVTYAGVIGGKPVVVVGHGDQRTTYEPVEALVNVGRSVTEGEVVGRLVVEHSHCFPAACLHWGLRMGDDYLDPLTLLGTRDVRLLPLWRDLGESTGPAVPALPWQPVLRSWARPIDALP